MFGHFCSVFELIDFLLHFAFAAKEPFLGYNIFVQEIVEIQHQAGSNCSVFGVLIGEFLGVLEVVVVSRIVSLIIRRMTTLASLSVILNQIRDFLVITNRLTKGHFLLICDQLFEVLALLGVEDTTLLLLRNFGLEFLG